MTLWTEIEVIFNSKPQGYVSSDVADPEPRDTKHVDVVAGCLPTTDVICSCHDHKEMMGLLSEDGRPFLVATSQKTT